MKRQAVNPFLPENEYIPDVEPRVFGNRVYAYGSHDRFNAPIFCMNDYICYSAPVDDLTNWTYEGVIYPKRNDPRNRHGMRLLFAPDVVQGGDGRYYMYYGVDFTGLISVAVCDTPAGQYEYLGDVCYADGTKWGRKRGDAFGFDPAVLVDEDGRVYLYSGFYKRTPSILTGMRRLEYNGCYVTQLQQDMKTIVGEPRLLLPKAGKGSFKGHEFFEASSIRKLHGKYYFVYSSRLNHELCYAVSDDPMEGFVYGGTLISNGDIGIDGYQEELHAANYTGNNHGGMLKIEDKYYIFYHRQTNRHSYSRQACAEEIILRADGGFDQTEMTSCGLNGGPLLGNGIYPARIACNLWSKKGTGRYDLGFGWLRYRKQPYLTQDQCDGNPYAKQYIANMRDGAVAGYKYFDIRNVNQITVWVSGTASGEMIVMADKQGKELVGRIPIKVNQTDWVPCSTKIQIEAGVKPLYFQYQGRGKLNFIRFELA